MNDYYKSIRAMSEEAISLTGHAESLRACSRHSGVEFDLLAKADEYEDKATELRKAVKEAHKARGLENAGSSSVHSYWHGHFFEFDIVEKATELEGRI